MHKTTKLFFRDITFQHEEYLMKDFKNVFNFFLQFFWVAEVETVDEQGTCSGYIKIHVFLCLH